jgi:hypothetical protein
MIIGGEGQGTVLIDGRDTKTKYHIFMTNRKRNLKLAFVVKVRFTLWYFSLYKA